MERLTERTTCGVANIAYPQTCYFKDGSKDQIALSAYRQLAIERLAAYEDTGLEPEEIKLFQARALLGALESPQMAEYSGSALERADKLVEQDQSPDAGKMMKQPQPPERPLVLKQGKAFKYEVDDPGFDMSCFSKPEEGK